MTAHTCTKFDPDCYRCNLNLDEIEWQERCIAGETALHDRLCGCSRSRDVCDPDGKFYDMAEWVLSADNMRANRMAEARRES